MISLNKYYTLFVFLILVFSLNATIQITTTLKIEQGAFGIEKFKFEIANTNYKFIFDSFEKSLVNGKYQNTNLYQYSNDISKYDNYNIKIEMITNDSIFDLNHLFIYDSEIDRIEIDCLIGKNDVGLPYIKTLVINRFSFALQHLRKFIRIFVFLF